MKSWENEEILKAVELNKDGLNYKKIGNIIGRTEKAVRVKLNRLGIKTNENTYHEIKTCECCGNNFKSLKTENRKYCSQSCSAKVNDVKYPKRVRNVNKLSKCVNCDKKLIGGQNKYCSVNCQTEFERKQIFEKIENGDTTLSKNQYKKYLIYVHGNKCMECGWDRINPVTGNVPIELEHIDGNSENNSLENIKLLCPNCHSLTPTYKALNVGNGRHSIRQRYKDGKSY